MNKPQVAPTFDIALLRVGLGALLFAPKSLFMVGKVLVDLEELDELVASDSVCVGRLRRWFKVKKEVACDCDLTGDGDPPRFGSGCRPDASHASVNFRLHFDFDKQFVPFRHARIPWTSKVTRENSMDLVTGLTKRPNWVAWPAVEVEEGRCRALRKR